VGRWSYLAVLAFVVIGSGWLEIFLRTRVLRRGLRLLLAMVPGVVLFMLWDMYAVSEGHWWFDTDRILEIYLPAKVPLEELLFFIVIPFASILTLEAVRSVKPHWLVPDQPGER
jgi:lycopene cyclase domain-containing protein